MEPQWEPPPGRAAGGADFVLVANRLPVERTVDEAGAAGWQTSPEGSSPRWCR